MSRYRDEQDDNYGGGRYARRRADDYPSRGDYYGGGGREGEDYRRERFGERPARPAFPERQGDWREEEETYVRRRDRYEDERAGLGARRAARYDFDFDEDEEYRRERERDRGGAREGRSLWDEGREYFRRAFGGGGGRESERERRGATRSHVRCRDIMTRDVTVATRETTLDAVARMMRDEDTGVIPVVERPPNLTDLADTTRPDVNRVEPNVAGSGGKLVGLITDRDIAVRAVAESKDARVTRAEEIMTTDIHTAQPNDRVIDAIRKMGDKQVRRIPIVDRDGNLRGIISMADVALETEQDRELAEALEEISSGASFWNRVFG